jgi:hypothetical protein
MTRLKSFTVASARVEDAAVCDSLVQPARHHSPGHPVILTRHLATLSLQFGYFYGSNKLLYSSTRFFLSSFFVFHLGSPGSVVVEELCHKSAGCGFHSRLSQLLFSLT